MTTEFPAFSPPSSALAQGNNQPMRSAEATLPAIVLELTVRNHPGTMSHITGLFARRAFNLEAIVCVPIADGETSRVRLLVRNDARLPQVEQQLKKLYDVLDVRERTDLRAEYFTKLAVA